jgi:hypothetical protein
LCWVVRCLLLSKGLVVADVGEIIGSLLHGWWNNQLLV